MTELKPFFSVVIPLYNKEKHIRRAIDSVLNQNYKDFELIIINDGSSDASGKIVEQYQDLRIKYFNQKNQGVSAARNTGINKSSSDFIAFLDADDEWKNDFLEKILELMKKYPENLVFSTSCYDVTKKENLKISTKEVSDGKLINIFKTIVQGKTLITSSSVCIHKNVFKMVGNFPEGVKRGEDLDTWIRIFLKFPIIFSLENKVIIHKDEEGGSEKLAGLDEKNSYVIEQLEEKIKMSQIPINLILDAKKLISKLYYWDIITYINHKKFTISLKKIFNNRMKYLPLHRIKLLLLLLKRFIK